MASSPHRLPCAFTSDSSLLLKEQLRSHGMLRTVAHTGLVCPPPREWVFFYQLGEMISPNCLNVDALQACGFLAANPLKQGIKVPHPFGRKTHLRVFERSYLLSDFALPWRSFSMNGTGRPPLPWDCCLPSGCTTAPGDGRATWRRRSKTPPGAKS